MHGRPKRRPSVSLGYRRILVPIVSNPESERAMDVACRLAAERHCSIIAANVIEVPPELPLDAHMVEEEEDARDLLERAHAVGETYGVDVSTSVLRGREAGTELVEHATATRAEIVVIGGARKSRGGIGAPIFRTTVLDVLRKAPCRVMVIAARPEARGQGAGASGLTSRYPTPASVRR
jgi:nucleotide-binding universal stress UspA family protein